MVGNPRYLGFFSPLFMSSTTDKRGQKRLPPPRNDGGGGKRPAAAVPTPPSDDDEADMCWLCHEDGPDESGHPLRRDCSCRGGSGWAHLPCIVDYAKQKTEQWDGRKVNKFRQPWRDCPGCKREYQDVLAVELANEFVSFVEEKYPDDQRMHVVALYRKLDALGDQLQPHQKEEVEQIANKILFIIEQMKTTDPSLPKFIEQFEAKVYNNLGIITLEEGTKESAKNAMEYFEKYRDICEKIGCISEVPIAESNIAIAKAKCEGGSAESNEEVLKNRQKVYKQRVATHGQEEVITINTGVSLAIDLKGVHRVIESERMLAKLVAISKRAHGPEHQITKRAESILQQCKVRRVKIKYGDEINVFQALRYEEDGEKCVVQGPIAKPRNIQAEQTLTVAADNIVLFAPGTPVICDGLKKATHLNGKIGDLRSWHEESGCFKVHFDDNNIEPCTVKNEFLQILFDLPEES